MCLLDNTYFYELYGKDHYELGFEIGLIEGGIEMILNLSESDLDEETVLQLAQIILSPEDLSNFLSFLKSLDEDFLKFYTIPVEDTYKSNNTFRMIVI